MSFCLIFSTTSSMEEAKKISYHLVTNKFAACVNIIPQITSVYSWKDEICEDTEFLLVIKTREELFEEVKNSIIKLHSYELPEIIMTPIENGHKNYLDWIIKETTV